MPVLTNIVIDAVGEECAGGEGALSQILMTVFGGPGGLFTFAQSYPTIRMFLAPPGVRNRPAWYPRFRPVVLRLLQQHLLSRPQNLELLEDFQAELDPDGVHYSIMSGVTFVQDLHDQACQLMLQPAPDPRKRWVVPLYICLLSIDFFMYVLSTSLFLYSWNFILVLSTLFQQSVDCSWRAYFRFGSSNESC